MSPDQISTFTNIYLILTQYLLVSLIIHHVVRHSWIISLFMIHLMSHAPYTWSSFHIFLDSRLSNYLFAKYNVLSRHNNSGQEKGRQESAKTSQTYIFAMCLGSQLIGGGGQAILGCTWLYWAPMSCTVLYRIALGCHGLYWALLGCFVLGCSSLYDVVSVLMFNAVARC